MSNEIEKTKPFAAIEDRFLEISNKETFAKECSFALQHFARNNYLAKATTKSKLQAVLNIAQIGLTLNPVLKLAYLIPRFEGGEVRCYLEPSYQGLVKLVTDTGSAKQIPVQIVYEGDEFEISLGSESKVIHKPKFKSKTISHVYAIAKLFDGSNQIEVMTYQDICEIRDNSESYKAFKNGKTKTCIWVDHEGEMCRKTVLKRLVKYLPKTEMWDKLGAAIDLDNQDYSASYEQKDYIDSLLTNANIDSDESNSIYRELETMSHYRASEVINYLKDNKVEPISAGLSYNQTDIKAKQSNENN